MPPAHPPPLNELVRLLQARRFRELVTKARAFSARWPESGPVWHLLGMAHLNLGEFVQAVSPLAQAAQRMPKDAEILEHLAIAQMRSGQGKDALRNFERCLELAPERPGTLVNAASLANELRNYVAAEKHCQRALRRAPNQPEALYQLARARRGLGRGSEAIATLRQAAALTRQSSAAQNDIGMELLVLGQASDAEACLRQALALAPDNVMALSNLGRLLQEQGKNEQALAALRRAAELAPQLAAVHANLSGILNAVNQHAAAEAAARCALQIEPDFAAAICNLGNALMEQDKREAAEACYRKVLAIDPAHADARNNLGNLLVTLKRFDDALTCFRAIHDDRGYALGKCFYCAGQLCDWHLRAQDEAALRAKWQSDDTYIEPFGLLALAASDAPQLQKRLGWLAASNHFGLGLLEPPPLADPAARPQRERLRIGYLSADFHDHATMHLMAGVLAAHDRARFAIHLYSHGPESDDDYRRLAREYTDVFRDVRHLTDADAAAQIVADGVDILVDLKGYTEMARLGISARRPAPIIVSWLGYPGTLGHPRLADYIIGDPVVTPFDAAGDYSEVIVQMPHCYQPNDRNRRVGACPSRAEAGLPEAGFVFCSFNQSYKFNPETADVWARLMQEIPGSVLWLLAAGAAVEENLRREFGQRGIAPQRLVFAPRLPLSEHLGRLQLADLALDTFPYGSHTTGSDALWVGVPMVTHCGNSFASRVGASLLNAAGLPELVTQGWDDYIALAADIARDASRLAALKARLAALRLQSPLFDTARFTQDIEKLYLGLWQR